MDIKVSVKVTIQQFQQLAGTETPSRFKEILAPTKCYYSEVQTYVDIIETFCATRKGLRSSGSQMKIENFHAKIAVPLIKMLINEINTAFDDSDFPVLDAFKALDPNNIPQEVPADYGKNSFMLLYSWYGKTKVDVFEGKRNEAAPVIKCDESTFISECYNFVKIIAEKKKFEESQYEKKFEQSKKKLLTIEAKKSTSAKMLKENQAAVEFYKSKIENPVSLEEAFEVAEEVFPNVSTILQLALICPASGAVVERGFSLMNLIMNDLRSSMNITTLDALMRISYQDDLDELQCNEIIRIWKKRGNRRIEL